MFWHLSTAYSHLVVAIFVDLTPKMESNSTEVPKRHVYGRQWFYRSNGASRIFTATAHPEKQRGLSGCYKEAEASSDLQGCSAVQLECL